MHTSDDLAVLESARTRARLRIIIGRGEMSFGVAEQSRGPPQLRKFYSTVLNVYAESVDCARARSVGTLDCGTLKALCMVKEGVRQSSKLHRSRTNTVRWRQRARGPSCVEMERNWMKV